MKALSYQNLEQSISKYKIEIKDHICELDNKLALAIRSKKIKVKNIDYELNDAHKLYLRFLKSRSKRLIYGDIDYLESQKSIFILLKKYIEASGAKFTPFKNYLINILGYEILRSDKNKALYPKFYKSLDIKACVYCNSLLIISTEKENGKLSARFQVDHFIDKGNFPCFSISFYNLYPVCGACNNKKGQKEIKFNLYSKNKGDISSSNFKFSVDWASVAQYRLDRKESDLKISFDDNNSELNKVLAVQSIYETQNDLVAEIILKSEVYSKTYKESLEKSFNQLYKSGSINFNRFILGNYTEEKDMHKRPMSKFTMDIARQLGLID